MIIKRGYAYNSSLEGHPHNAYGGGAYMVKGSMMRDVWIECCEASRNGGAVYMDGGGVCDHVYVTTSQAQGIGTSYGYGGGVCIETNPAISDVAPVETGFRYGMIANCAARQGGGLAILTSRNTFTETYTNPVTGEQAQRTREPANYEDQRNKAYAYASIVAHNVALIEGGGIYTSGGGAMSQMTIVGNACYGTATIVNGVTQGRSGGLYSSDKVTVHNSVLCGNYAMSNNGIQYATSRTSISEDLKALMEYCRVENNDVTDWRLNAQGAGAVGYQPSLRQPPRLRHRPFHRCHGRILDALLLPCAEAVADGQLRTLQRQPRQGGPHHQPGHLSFRPAHQRPLRTALSGPCHPRSHQLRQLHRDGCHQESQPHEDHRGLVDGRPPLRRPLGHRDRLRRQGRCQAGHAPALSQQRPRVCPSGASGCRQRQHHLPHTHQAGNGDQRRPLRTAHHLRAVHRLPSI